MLLYDGEAVHTQVVRLFILERKGLELDVQPIDVANLENRRLPYRTQVNLRGEVPALRLDDGTVLTEVTALYQYLDEVAEGGTSLFGANAIERAITNMWLRRVDLEIVQPLVRWFRDGPATVDFYRGNRVPVPEAQLANKVSVNQGLNLLDDHLEDGRSFICGDRFSAADIHLYGMLKVMSFTADWLNPSGRTAVAAWMKRMDEREASAESLKVFGSKVKV